jgi:hypothetical protein
MRADATRATRRRSLEHVSFFLSWRPALSSARCRMSGGPERMGILTDAATFSGG